VLSKEELTNAVWPDVFVTESVLTRAIVGLRRALGDDAKRPRFIETIAKRGYRLLLAPVAEETATGAGAASAPRLTADDARAQPAGSPTPYAVGQWVRGAHYFGRAEVLAEILAGPRQAIWLLGARAIGKTSTLRQLELLARETPQLGLVPVYWDLQGSDDPERLAGELRDALPDELARLAATGDVDETDLFALLTRLRRAVAAEGRTLLLLVDEAEELLALGAQAPSLLRKLRRAFQSHSGLRTVLAASARLWRLNDVPAETSPFLHGFAPPLYLGALGNDDARQLLSRAGSEPAATPLAASAVDRLVQLAGGHPYLLQLLGAAFWKLRDLERTAREVGADPTLRAFFAVDFELLSPAEQALLAHLAARGATPAASRPGLAGPSRSQAADRLHLERLGMLRRTADDEAEIASPIFADWLRERPLPGDQNE
jgi:hypothetical protein